MNRMVTAACAIHDFLAEHNIPGRNRVRLILVVEEPRTQHAIEDALRSDKTFMAAYHASACRRDIPPGYEAMIDGIPVAIRVPKSAVEV